MNADATLHLDALSLMQTVTLHVHVKHFRQAQLRVRFATWLIRLGVWAGGLRLEVHIP